MKKISRPMFIAVLALGLMVAGCGGSSDSSSTATSSTAALTKADYLEQGNAICKAGSDELNAKIQATFTSKPSAADLAKFSTETAIPIVEDEVTKLKALPAPAGDEDQVSAMLAAIDSGLAKVKADPGSISVGKDAGGNLAEADKLANAYGLTVCGS